MQSGSVEILATNDQRVEIRVVDRGKIDGLQREVEAEVQVPILRAVNRKALPFKEDRQVGRFLKLEDEDAVGNCVRKARGDEHCVA